MHDRVIEQKFEGNYENNDIRTGPKKVKCWILLNFDRVGEDF